MPISFYWPCHTICINHCLLVAWYLNSWLGLGWGFKFCWSQCIPRKWHKPNSFWTFCISQVGNTLWTGSSFCPAQLDYVRHTPPINTCKYQELCKTWCIFDWIGSWLGTHHGQHHSRFFGILTAAPAHLLASVYTNLHILATLACKFGLTAIRILYVESLMHNLLGLVGASWG